MNKKELKEYLSCRPVSFITGEMVLNAQILDYICDQLLISGAEYADKLVEFILTNCHNEEETNFQHYKNIDQISIFNDSGIDYEGNVISCYDQKFNSHCDKCIFKKSKDDCLLNYPAEFYKWANQKYKAKYQKGSLVFVSNNGLNWVVRCFCYTDNNKYYVEDVKTHKIEEYNFCKPYVLSYK